MKAHLFNFLMMLLCLLGHNNHALAAVVAESMQYPFSEGTAEQFYDYVISQRTGEWNPSWGGYHLAYDVLAPTGTELYAIADGTVKESSGHPHGGYGDACGAVGYLILIESELPDGTIFTVNYGHVQNGSYDEDSRSGLIPEGAVVRRGQYIGKVADYYADTSADQDFICDNANWSHVHLGIHIGSYSPVTSPAGYSSSVGTWIDPVDFIEAHLEPVIPANVRAAIDYKSQTLWDAGLIREELPDGDMHWWGPVVIEDWDGGLWGGNANDTSDNWVAIIYDDFSYRAYALRHAFWHVYRDRGGPSLFGPPRGDELDLSSLHYFQPDDNQCAGREESCIQQFCGSTDQFSSMQRFANATFCYYQPTGTVCLDDPCLAEERGDIPYCGDMPNYVGDFAECQNGQVVEVCSIGWPGATCYGSGGPDEGVGSACATGSHFPITRLRGNDFSSYYDADSSADVDLELYGSVAQISYLDRLRGTQAVDLSGDGHSDLLQVMYESGTYRFVVRRATGNGGFYDNETWKTTTRNVAHVFLGKWNDDSRPDLILGLPINGGKMEWRVCVNEGNKFADNCDWWQAQGTSDGTFGDTNSDFVIGDFDGNGKIELLRGKKYAGSCTTSRQWKRLQPNGQRFDLMWNTNECHGYDGSFFLAGNVDNDGKDEFVYVRSTDTSVEVFVSNFHEPTQTMQFSQWASDVGGPDGTYFLYDITRDGKADILRWRDGNLAYSANTGGSFWEQSQQRSIASFAKSGKDNLLFGDFGIYTETTCE